MRTAGFRMGIHVFANAEVMDYAGPYGVFSLARRLDPELEVFLLAETPRPVTTLGGLVVQPTYGLADAPALDALLLPGGPGTRQQLHNRRLHDYILGLPASCLLASTGAGAWIYARLGLLDGLAATSRKAADRLETTHLGRSPLDRLALIAPSCRLSQARVVDAGRLLTAGGPSAGTDLALHLLRRAGYGEDFVQELVRLMEYQQAYAQYRDDIEYACRPSPASASPAPV